MKMEIAGCSPRVSDSVGVRWGLRICFANKCPGVAEAAGWRTTLW